MRAAFKCRHCETYLEIQDIDQAGIKLITSLDFECPWCGLNAIMVQYPIKIGG